MLDRSHPAARARALHDAERSRPRVAQFSKRRAGMTIADPRQAP